MQSYRHVVIRVLVIVTLALAASSALLAEIDVCTRLPARVSYPLPVLAQPDPIDQVWRGDFDGDGTRDLFIGTSRPGQYRIWRVVQAEDHTISLELLLEYPDPLGTYEFLGASFGDLDGDGVMDIVVNARDRQYGKDKLTWFQGLEDGAMGPGVLVRETDGSFLGPEIGDFDGDGVLELAFTEPMQREHDFLRIFEIMDGSWIQRAATALYLRPQAMGVGDLDQDGIDDLAITQLRYPSKGVFVYFGDAYSPADRVVVGSSSARLTWVEIVGGGRDGKPRLLTGWYWSPGFITWQYDPQRRVYLPVEYQEIPETYDAPPEAWDADSDGLEDLVYWERDYSGSLGSRVLLGRVGAPFEEDLALPGGHYLLDLMLLDEDSEPDALVSGLDDVMTRFTGLGDFRFDPGLVYTLNEEPDLRKYTTGDLDGDGLDEIVGYRGTGKGFIYRATGGGAFEWMPEKVPELPRDPDQILLRDLDADGSLDLIAKLNVTGQGLWYAWGQHGGFGPVQQIPFDRTLGNLLVADITGDGQLDLLLEVRSEGRGFDLHTLIVDSRVLSPGAITLAGPRVYHDLAAADLDGDARADLVYSALQEGVSSGTKQLFWRPGQGDGQFGEEHLLVENAFAHANKDLRISDLDGDGDQDILVDYYRCSGWGKVMTWLNDGQAGFRRAWYGPVGECGDYLVADLDGDSLLDLVEAEGYGYFNSAFRVYPGDGAGGFADHGEWFYGGTPPSSSGGDVGHFSSVLASDILVRAYGLGLRPWTVNPQQTLPLSEDIAPPRPTVGLWPEVDPLVDPPTFEKVWRVFATASDECSSVDVTELKAGFPLLAPDTPVVFRGAAQEQIRVYKDTLSGQSWIYLFGKDELISRKRLARVRAAGGFVLGQNTFLKLTQVDEVAAPDGESSGRLVYEARLSGETLRGLSVYRPVKDITFFVTAVDATGRSGFAEATFAEEKERFCGSGQRQDVVCD